MTARALHPIRAVGLSKVARRDGILEGAACGTFLSAIPHPRGQVLGMTACVASCAQYRRTRSDAQNAPASVKPQVESLWHEAGLLYESRDFDRAFDLLGQAARISHNAGDKRLEAVTYTRIGSMYNFRGEATRAIPTWSRAAILFHEIKDRRLEATALSNLGSWQFETGDHAAALGNLQRALRLAAEVEPRLTHQADWLHNRDTTADTLASLADVYRRLGQPARALETYRLAREKFLQGYIPGRAHMILVDIADVEASLGHDDAAERDYELALLGSPDWADPWTALRARIGYGAYLTGKGRYAPALELFDEALPVARRNRNYQYEAECLLRRGFAELGLRRPQQALASFEDALKVADAFVPIAALQWRAHHGRGRALAALGRHKEAVEEYEKAVEILNRWLRGIPQTSENPARTEVSLWTPFHDAILANLRLGDRDRAMRLSEMAKCGLIALNAQQLDLGRWLSPDERKEDDRRKRLVNELRERHIAELQANPARSAGDGATGKLAAELKRAESDYEAFRQQVYRSHPQAPIARGDLPPAGLAEARRLAADGGITILDYVVTGRDVVAFLIDGAGAASFRLPITAAALARLTEELVQVYRTDPTGASRSAGYPSAAYRLYGSLLPPKLDFRLRRARAVCVIPDGVLWSVPFEILWNRSGGRPRYLLERFPICYSPSISALRVLWKNPDRASNAPARWRVAAIGSPDLGREKQRDDPVRGRFFSRLSVAETSMVRSLFGARALIYEKSQATKAAARHALASCDLVHFGCHGIFNDQSPLYSALLMARTSRSEDGFLEAREIATLPIRAQLVVLAACDTGRGEAARGQGLIGMTWALFVGGARACVVTRWQIDDRATAQLVKVFYQSLLNGRTKSDALRTAQLSLMNPQSAYHHPYYWAGLMLIGR